MRLDAIRQRRRADSPPWVGESLPLRQQKIAILCIAIFCLINKPCHMWYNIHMVHRKTHTYLEWEAPEYKEYVKSWGWYAGLIVIALLLAAYQTYVGDYFGAATIIILGVLVAWFAGRKPEVISIALTGEGIQLGDLHIPYKNFRHFWIVDTPHHKTLNLEASTYLKQIVIVELADEDPIEVRKIVGKHVDESEAIEPSFSQRIAQRFHF